MKPDEMDIPLERDVLALSYSGAVGRSSSA